MQKSVSDAAAAAPAAPAPAPSVVAAAGGAAVPVLFALGLAHLLNDLMQSLVQAIYPLIRETYKLDLTSIGIITATFQITASVFQPIVGYFFDRNPRPYSAAIGMGSTLAGLMVLATASSYSMLLVGAALVGTGSSIFHPEATRVARIASAGRLGFGQSIFQLGGQTGSAVGPLLAAYIVVPHGQRSLVWFGFVALAAMAVLAGIGRWTISSGLKKAAAARKAVTAVASLPARQVYFAIAILLLLMYTKTVYSSVFSSYYTFYLIHHFDVSVQTSQVLLFLYLAANAVGALLGGWLGDITGRRAIIWISILGALPFTAMLPYANLTWTAVLSVVIAFIMSSSFSAILVYAIELMPRHVGFIGGLFYGLVFGLGGINAAMFGRLADATSIEYVFWITSLVPVVGLLAWFLPHIKPTRA